MILEGIVTTLDPAGALNIAPMGPRVELDLCRLLLRPFRTAHTYQNLRTHGEGVFHVIDDVWLLARAAVGPVVPQPETFPAAHIRGQVLRDACRYYEFRVASLDDRQDRTQINAEVVHAGRLRDFFGFNRAKHAVLEAAILATRTAFLPSDEIEAAYRRLAVLVDKTGGAQEHRAFSFLRDHVARVTGPRPPEMSLP